MRLIGAGKSSSLVTADVSASLRGLGRGDDTVGGIALMAVTPQGFTDTFDAVVVMPHGVLLIAGVELPGPTMRLDAPLYSQWKADNWPLVGNGQAVNPGAPALAAAQRLARRLTEATGLPVPIGTVLAVGPFVDTVTPGDGDLQQPVRVVYPTINGLKDAIAALTPPNGQPCSVEQARALLRAVDPATPIQPDSTLAKEGFPSAVTTAHSAPARQTGDPAGANGWQQGTAAPGTPAAAAAGAQAPHARSHAPSPSSAGQPPAPSGQHASAQPAGHPYATAPPTPPMSPPAPIGHPAAPRQLPTGQLPQPGRPARQRSALLRPLPIVVVALLVVGLIAVIAVTTAGASDSPASASGPANSDLVIHDVDGLDFEVVAADTDRQCGSRTYGDLRTAVEQADCTGVHLGSYLTSIDDRRAAVSVAVFEFESVKQARRLEKLADTPGTGWAVDLATTRDAWPDAAGAGTARYRSAESGGRLRLVGTVWLDDRGEDLPGETGTDTLNTITRRAFAVPMPNLR